MRHAPLLPDAAPTAGLCPGVSGREIGREPGREVGREPRREPGREIGSRRTRRSSGRRAWRAALLLAAALAAPASRAQTDDAPIRPAREAVAPEVTLVKALTRLHAADPAAAVALLRAALDTDPGNAPFLGLLADATLALGDRTSARVHARAALDAAPADAEAAVRLARLLAADGDDREARQTLDDALARAASPTAAAPSATPTAAASASARARLLDASLDLALAARDDARATDAARRLDRDGALAPALADPERRARLLPVLVRTDGALADAALAAALRLDPFDGPMWRLRADRAAATGQTDAAAQARRLAARLDPTRSSVPAAATPDLATSGAATPSPAPTSPTPGVSGPGSAPAGSADRTAEAERLAAAVEATPRDGALWRQAAMAWLEAGRADRAAALLDDARLIFAGDAALHLVAAWHALAHGTAEAARAALADADAALADTPDAATADAALVRRALAAARAVSDRRPMERDDALVRAGLLPAPGGALARRLAAR